MEEPYDPDILQDSKPTAETESSSADPDGDGILPDRDQGLSGPESASEDGASQDGASEEDAYHEAGHHMAPKAACSVGSPGSASYCTEACPCDDEEGDCDGDSQCAPGLRCVRDVGAIFDMNPEFDVCLSQCVSSYPDAPTGSEDYCSEDCPCEESQGDCDNSAECAGSLRCAFDAGASFGYDPETDVCVSVCSDFMNGHVDHCSIDCPCEAGEGDCDSDADCAPGLSCIRDIGAEYGFSPLTDVCIALAGQCPAEAGIPVGNEDFCSDECPCEEGQGDCDRSSECAVGLGCAFDSGAAFGFDEDTDVCVNVCDDLLNGHVNHCSLECPCEAGEGDCDSDAECFPGHVCVSDVGATYGFPADRDVCEEAPVFVNFAGRVIDNEGQGVDGASLSINGISVQTNVDGSFNLSILQAERYVINAEQLGYVPSSRVHAGAGIEDLVIAMQAAQTFAIDPAEPVAVVDDAGSEINLPANALVDAAGNPVTEPVVMQVHTFDVLNEGMIGNMEATDDSGAPVILESVGAISVDFFGESGTQYQLGAGSAAEIVLQVPEDYDYSGPIAMWHYDLEAGRWIEEGVGVVENGVARATVSHFSTWNFDVKRDDPACVRVFVVPPLATNGGSIQARVAVKGPFPTTRTVDLSGGHNALYNLPPDTPIEMFVPPESNDPYVSISTGAPWGGTGVPEFPYQGCNGEIRLEGALPGTLAGFIKLDQRGNAEGVTVQATSGSGDPVASTGVSGDGRYALTVDSGTYNTTMSMPGYVSLHVDNVDVVAGKVVYQPCVKLRAGDVNGDDRIDSADEALVSDRLDSAAEPGDPADFNGDLSIDISDLEALQGNLGIIGPLTANDSESNCFDNSAREREPNDDGTPATGGGTRGNDFLASAANGPYRSSVVIEAEYSPSGDEDIFAIYNPSNETRTVELETFNRNLGYGARCDYSVDTVIRVRNEAGDSLAYNDDNVGYCSFVRYQLPAGATRYVHLIEYGDNGGGGYYLDIRFVD